MTGITVIIPVRGRHGGKTRLATELNADERAVLITSMATQVIASVIESGVAGSIVVVSREADMLRHSPFSDREVTLLHQPVHSFGLNAAIDLGRQEALRRNATSALVLSADLPLLCATVVGRFVGDDSSRADVVLATDRAGLGTNALLLNGRAVISTFSFHFGHGSRRLHRIESQRLAVTYAERDAPELSLDLDTPGDWAMLSRQVRQDLLIPYTTQGVAPIGPGSTEPVAVLERA